MTTNLNHNKPAIIFDLGGVLMDWSPYYLYSDVLGLTKEQVDQFLREVDFSGWNVQNDRGRCFAETTVELSAQFPEYKELIHAYDDMYLDSLHGAFPETVDVLKTLKDNQYPLFVLSNWPAEKFALIRKQHDFFNWFDDMVISGEVGLVKPGEEIFQLMLDRIGRPARDCIYIDDHQPNINTAKKLGFLTILFENANQLEKEIDRLETEWNNTL